MNSPTPSSPLDKKVKVKLPKVHFSGTEKHYSLQQLLIFALVFAAVGAYFLWKTLAATVLITSLEAENMTLPSSGGSSQTTTIQAEDMDLTGVNAAVVNDSAADGGQAVAIYANGAISQQFNASGTVTQVKVTARGTKCGNGSKAWPYLSVNVDNQRVIGHYVTSSWTGYASSTLSLPSGSHNLSISFNNNYTSGSCDRDLFIDKTTISQSTAPTLAEVLNDSTASGGKDVALYQNASLSGNFSNTAAITSLSVSAQSVNCNSEWAHMVVKVDGTQVLDTFADSSSWKVFPAAASIAAGSHSLSITYDNDLSGSCDRNLYIDKTEFFGESATSSTVTLHPTADTYVSKNNPGTSYGSATSVAVDSGDAAAGDNVLSGYLKFDLSGLSSLQSAKLRFYVSNETADTDNLAALSDNSWSESVTWSNKPATGSTITTINPSTVNAWYEVDLTSYLAAKAGQVVSLELDNPGPGFNGLAFGSRESTTPPELVVTTGAPVPSVTLTANPSSVTSGGSSTLTWTTANVSSCAASGDWSGSKVATDGSHSETITNITTAKLFTITCTDGSHPPVSSSAGVTLTTTPPPTSLPACTKTLTSATTAALSSAMGSSNPDDVICLPPGTYNVGSQLFVSRSGSSGKPIYYRSSDTNNQALLKWTGGSIGGGVLQVNGGSNWSGVHDIVFDSLTIDAANLAGGDIFVTKGAHHVTIRNSILKNGGGVGIGLLATDYVTAENNQIYHFGYEQGWGSGVSLWYSGKDGSASQGAGGATAWYSSTDTGFHNVIANNIISGGWDSSVDCLQHSDPQYCPSDGNGIIIDGSNNLPLVNGGSIPPALIIGNVTYQIGGRGIEDLGNSGNVWVVNNTSYSNGLDLNVGDGHAMEYQAFYNGGPGIHWINNIAYGRKGFGTYTTGYLFNNTGSSNVAWQQNIGYNGTNEGISQCATTSSSTYQCRNVNPLFSSVPAFPGGATPWASAVAPWNLGTALRLQAGSPAVNAGQDPKTASGMNTALQTVLNKYLAKDAAGQNRYNGAIDIGAYEQ